MSISGVNDSGFGRCCDRSLTTVFVIVKLATDAGIGQHHDAFEVAVSNHVVRDDVCAGVRRGARWPAHASRSSSTRPVHTPAA